MAGPEILDVEIGHRRDRDGLVGGVDHAQQVPEREGRAACQVGQVEIHVAGPELGLQHREEIEVFARIHVEFAYQPRHVADFIEFADDVVIADDDEHGQVVIEDFAPERRRGDRIVGRAVRAAARADEETDDRADRDEHECGGGKSQTGQAGPGNRRLFGGLRLRRHDGDAILALRDRDLQRLVTSVRAVVLAEFLAKVVGVDANHRVLARIEVRSLAEHLSRNLQFLRRAPLAGAVDQELEQPHVGGRTAESAARDDPVGLFAYG